MTEQEHKIQAIAWYHRKELGIPRAMLETIKQALLDPRRFWACLEIERPASEPFLFYILVTLAANALGLFFDMFFQSQMVWPAYFFVVLFILPILVAIGFYLLAALLYVFILFFKGRARFKELLTIVAYAGAANVFYIIPVWGPLLAAVGTGVLYALGLMRFFQLKAWKAVVIVVLLFALLFTMLAISINGIQQFTENKMRVNETLAESTLKSIALSIEKFSQEHAGTYPKDELEMRYAQPAYLDRAYNNENIQGYAFALNLSDSGYEILTAPMECGVTGFEVYRIKTGGLLEQGNCTSVKPK
ncbi:MAG: YIP1 family protein [Candidatus Omnitrophota bacterium]|nr:MAG: YIP1 family protein [Candidatus Omnitrophota bacterium]